MKKSFAWVALIAALVGSTIVSAAGVSSWPSARHDPALTNFNPDERLVGSKSVSRLKPTWFRPNIPMAVAGPNRVFAIVQGRGGTRVVVYGSRTGHFLQAFGWRKLGLSSGAFPHALAYVGNKVIVATTEGIVALDPDTGVVLWRRAVPTTAMTVNSTAVYTGAGCQNTPDICGTVASYAFGLGRGRLLWKHDGNLGGEPALIGRHLYQNWGTYGGETHVYDPASGRLLGKIALNASWTGDQMNTYADVLTGPGKRSWLGKISPEGKTAWKVDLGIINGNPSMAYAYGTLLVASNRRAPGLTVVDSANGHVRWSAPLGANLQVAVANHIVFVLHRGTGWLNALDSGTGRKITTIHVPRYVPSGSRDVFVAGGTLYVLSGRGLTALRTGS